MKKRTLVLFIAGLLTACGGGTDSSTLDANTPPIDAEPQTVDATAVNDAASTKDTASPPDSVASPDTARPPIQSTYETFIGDWNMKPGKEVTKCVRKRLDNETAIWVTAIQTKLSQGSHHLIVYKSTEETEILEPENCAPFTETLGGETVPLMITQVGEETLELPAGVAFKFEPNQMIRLEAHYLNYYADDITAHSDVTFQTIAEEDVEHEADMLFYGTPDFSIPPGEEYTTPWHFIDVWEDTKIFAITGHTHQYGTNVEISASMGNDDPGVSIYPKDTPFTWDEAPIEQFSPPLSFGSGEGLRYRCTWNNTGTQNVEFGESANKEMCFLWAYYYPSNGYRMCVSPGDIASGFDLGEQVCCPDDAWLCYLVKGFLSSGGF